MTTEAIPRWFYRKVKMSASDWLVDCVIAAGSFGIAMLQLSLAMNLFVPDAFTRMLLGITSVAPSPIDIAIALCMSATLIFRRKLPWLVLALCIGIWLAASAFLELHDLPIVCILVALFTVCYEGSGRESAIASTVCVVAMLASYAFSPSSNYSSLTLFQNVSLSIAVALAGYALSVRNDYLREANDRAREAELLRMSEARRARDAEATRESEAARRVEEERVRIARELHDIVGHSLSAISIQAAAAERLVSSNPDAAMRSISEIRATAKTSLSDMRSLVSVLRSDDNDGGSPTSGTDQLGELADYLERAGIHCDLIMGSYDRALVPSHIDVALFGIAREACTNIVRHAHARHAMISIETAASDGIVDQGADARLVISDDGIGMSSADHGDMGAKGHGMDGMRERASILGGTLSLSGAVPSGLAIEVSIPLAGKVEADGSGE